MSFLASDFNDESAAWGSPPDLPGIVKDAVKKEQTLKEIAAAREALRALLSRVKTVQDEIDKLTSGNATLQMYINNLTLQMAKRR